MNVESLDAAGRAAVFKAFYKTTHAALVQVCGKSELQAEALIEGLRRRFADAPSEERNWIIHNDPVALAVDLAGLNWSDIQADPALEAFNKVRRAHAADF